MLTKTSTTKAEGSLELTGSVTAERRPSCNSAPFRSNTYSIWALATAFGAHAGRGTGSGCVAASPRNSAATFATSWHVSLEWA
jgi:hypothetical protein